MIIRRAEPGDEAELTAMIHELAEFERASDECVVTETQMRTALFGETPTVHGHIAEVDGKAAAARCGSCNFSTWDGVAGIYLEDLFVRPQFRRHGLARALLATLARECVDNGYTGCRGRCWTGTSTPSRSTTPSAGISRPTGSPIGFPALSCRRSPSL